LGTAYPVLSVLYFQRYYELSGSLAFTRDFRGGVHKDKPPRKETNNPIFAQKLEIMAKRALITGQDGSYLSELLLKKSYEVHGIKRRASSFNTSRIDHLYQDPT
jgi:hypothetical protein